jgi:DNA-binding MarR family transcriptional regulator
MPRWPRLRDWTGGLAQMTTAAELTALLAAVPKPGRARALGRIHLLAVHRQNRVIRDIRALGGHTRTVESLWVVMEACVAHFESRRLTQKDIAARASGVASAATVSRSIQDLEMDGWISTVRAPDDMRIRLITPTLRALEYFDSLVEPGWQAFIALIAAVITEGEASGS